MADIPVAKLKDDVLDRLSSLTLAGQLSDQIKTKLQSDTRVAQALNQALVLFVREANLGAIRSFVQVATLTVDTNVGDGDGIQNGVKTLIFPEDTLAERERMGLAKIILNGNEHEVAQGHVSSLDTVRHAANSIFYGKNYEVFNIDYEYKRIYVPEEVETKARYVSYPETINEDATYGSTNAADIPIRDSFLQDIASIALRELLKMATGFGNAPAEPETEKTDQ